VEASGLQAFGERREGRYVLKVVGEIDLSTVDQFKNAVVQAMAALEQIVVIDLSAVDSTGITALMETEASSRGDVDRIRFLNRFQPGVEAVLRMSGIYEELQLVEPDTLPSRNDL
jgi:anti-anti-sigma factor